MTKEEYLAGVKPFEAWKEIHDKNAEKTLKEMREWFEVDRFIEDHKNLASEEVLKGILVLADTDYNYDLGELEDYLAKTLVIPYKDIVEYRTERFWDEVKEDLNTYRVWAKMIDYVYVDIKAKSKEEAIDKAVEMDGGEFIPTAKCGWEIMDEATEVINGG